MKKYFGMILVLSVTVLSFQNCAVVGDAAGDPSLDGDLTGQSNPEMVQNKAMAVINSRCVSCHNPLNPKGGIDYLGDVSSLLFYRMIVPKDPGSSLLYQVIQEGEMPPAGSLSDQEITAINDWINDGFSSDAPVKAPPVVSTNLEAKYSNILKNVFMQKCLSCHSSAKAFGGVVVDTYAATRNLVTPGVPNSSVLLTALMPGGKMADKGVTGAELGVIRDWIMNGAQNN